MSEFASDAREDASSLDEVKEFLVRFREKERALEGLRFERDQMGFAALLNGFAPLYRLWKHHERTQASRFDVFGLLNLSRYEEKFHTPFLAALLTPWGSHAQGDLFYRSFIEAVLPEKDHQMFGPSRLLKTTSEKNAGTLGRIDILLHGCDPENPFAVVIENKIYADDQPEQLVRYLHYAKKWLNLPDERIRLLYLTIEGSSPHSKSISWKENEEEKQLEEGRDFHNISYRKHIKGWLNGVLPQVQAPLVQATLQQYLRTLNKI